MEEIVVSVFCLAYNHEKYIRNALEGFVMQKTNFAFEVLIHDDASTDNTAKIIKEYERQYPNIIKPIYQTENQYSKRVKITRDILLPQAKGKYFAWCEGDDYWTVPLKLQKQVDFLSANPEYATCVHRAKHLNTRNNTFYYCPDITEERDFSTEEIICGEGGIFETNSLMQTREAYINRPDVFSAKWAGDYQLFVHGSIYGKCRCLYDCMSVYNAYTESSWTLNVWADKERRKQYLKSRYDMLKKVDEYYNFKYHGAIDYVVRRIEFDLFELNGNKKSMRLPQYKEFYKTYRINKTKEKLRTRIPFLLKIKKLYQRILSKKGKANYASE